jgi:hypothetical protein
MKKSYKLLLFLLIFVSSNTLALPEKLNEELEDYKVIFEQDNKTLQISTAKKLEWSGFSDVSLFDIIEKNLLTELNSESKQSKFDLEYLSWLAKALAFSGQPKYISTLTQVIDGDFHKKLRKYATQSLGSLPHYTQWNKLIISEEKWNDQVSNDVNRFISMIQSKNIRLITLASKRVYGTHEKNDLLLDAFETELLTNYENAHDRHEIKAWAFTMKAIAGFRQEKHKKTLQLISESAKSKKLRRYAKKYLKYYQQ